MGSLAFLHAEYHTTVWMRREAQGIKRLTAWVAALGGFLGASAWTQAQVAVAPQDARQTSSATLQQYCLTCHNSTLKTAGVVIDPPTVAQPAANAELWERVIRQLRSNTMPPAGAPRPDQATYDKVASHLEHRPCPAGEPRPGQSRDGRNSATSPARSPSVRL